MDIQMADEVARAQTAYDQAKQALLDANRDRPNDLELRGRLVAQKQEAGIALQNAKFAAAAANQDVEMAGGRKRRKYSRKYCKKTPCRKMGFSQRASCRPYKNCFTRRARRRS